MSVQEPLDTPKPWKTGQDDPQTVLSSLIDKAVKDLRIPADIEARLRHRVGENPEPLLKAAEEYRHYYNQARRYNSFENSSFLRRPITRRAAWVAYALAGSCIVAGTITAAWQISSMFEANNVIVAASMSTLGVVWLVLTSSYRRERRSRLRRRIWTLLLPASLGGYIALGASWQGLAIGVPGSIAQFIITLGVFANIRHAARLLDNENYEQYASTMFELWRIELFEKAVHRAAIDEVNRAGSVYDIRLHASTRSYMDPDTLLEIDTPATKELRRLLQQDSGSFALAGPRGSGKTTLLEQWLDGRYLTYRHSVVLSVRVDAPTGYDPKEFVVYLFGRVCDEVERVYSSNDPFSLNADLVALARDNRNKIRFLQSRTTERELAVDVTWGAKLGAKRKVAVKRDLVPLNHPELVDEFRKFLRRITGPRARVKRCVLIGIDELDRISDGSQAEKFINELKAVFNVPRCFFLVSVSEDALADFELSAMGMRTAFDSSFDTVVRVDYMGFKDVISTSFR